MALTEREEEELNRLWRAQGMMPPAQPVQPAQPAQPPQAAALAGRIQQYTPAQPGAAELSAQDAYDEAEALRLGSKRYDKEKWRGTGLLGTPVAALINKIGGKKKQAGFTDTARNRLSKARELSRFESKRTGLDKARGLALGEEARINLQEDQQLHSKATAKEQRDWSETAAETKLYWDGTNPNRVRSFKEDRQGRMWKMTSGGRRRVYPDEDGLVPYQAPSTGSGATRLKQAKRDDLKRQSDAGIRPFIDDMKNLFGAGTQNLKDSMGKLDPSRWRAEFGLYGEDDPRMQEIAELQGTMDRLTFENMVPMLEYFTGSKSDKELQTAMDTSPGRGSNPLDWITHFERRVIPQVISKARIAGIRSKVEIDALEDELKTMLADARAKHLSSDSGTSGMSDAEKELRRRGLI